MSQPDPTTQTTTDAPAPPPGGAAALAAAASRTRGSQRQTRHVPTAKVPKKPQPPSPESPQNTPQEDQGVPNQSVEGKDTGHPPNEPENANQPPKAEVNPKAAGGAEEVPKKPQPEPEPKLKPESASDGPAVKDEVPPSNGAPEPTEPSDGPGTEIIHPPAPPNFSRLFQPKATPTMDPVMLAMYTERQAKLAKSLRNIMDMFLGRWTEYSDLLDKARKEGFPEDEIQRIAIQHNVDAPPAPDAR